MNANDVQHTATCVLLNIAKRAETEAAAQVAVTGEPGTDILPYRSADPRVRARLKGWSRTRWLRRFAKEYRTLAEQPERDVFNRLRKNFEQEVERDVFNRLRKNFEQEVELRGGSFKIGDPNPPLGEAIEMMKKFLDAATRMPVTHGPQLGSDAEV